MHLRLAFTIYILLFTITFFKCPYCISQFQKRNIIIFFTKPDIDENVNPIDDTGIQFLKFPVSGEVQSDDEIPEEFENIFKINLNSPDCNAIFSTYLLDLINWAIEDRGMITATVSSRETDFNRVILKNIRSSFQGSYKNFQFTLHLPRNLKFQRKVMRANPEPLDPYRIHASYEHEFENLPLATINPPLGSLPPLRFENHGDVIRDITAYNFIDTDNDEFGFKRVRSKLYMESKKYKTTTSLTTKRKSKEKKTKKTTVPIIITTAATTTKNPKNILTAISFFNKLQNVFMDSLLNPYEKRNSDSEEDRIDFSILGKVNENNMLKVVQSTLKSLKMQSSEQDTGINGFLMIIIGGNMSEISDPFSELIQSVKYVIEHTNKQDTLILVTCYCPIRSLENRIEKRRIPYFAGGVDCDYFKNTASMWAFLDKMKTSIKTTWKKGKTKVNQIIHPNKNTNSGDNKENISCDNVSEEENDDTTNQRKKRATNLSESSNALLAYEHFGVVLKFVLLFDILVYYSINV